MVTELEHQAELIRLRRLLSLGRAQEIVRQAGLTNADVARIIGVSAPSVWGYFNTERRPRRATALRLSKLLEQLSVVLRDEDLEKVIHP